MECSICVECFNLSTRKKICCPHCELEACSVCCRKHVLSLNTTEATCMGCSKHWNRKFLCDNFPGSFVTRDYKNHLEDVLLNREKALLPSTQPHVDRYLKSRQARKDARKVETEITNWWRQYRILQIELDTQNRLSNPFAHELDKERAVTIRKCPDEACRGFLTRKWKCGVCNKYTCKHCNELLPPEYPHVCNPDTVATVELLKKDTKSCPKCGTGISKIEGCSQMWCPDCQTPFDWRTGKELNGVTIHNPHYFEWVRENGRVPDRTPGDVRCGGVPRLYETLAVKWRNLDNHGFSTTKNMGTLLRVERIMHHVEDRALPYLPQAPTISPAMSQSMRVQYMVGEMTEDMFKMRLQREEKKIMKKYDYGQVLTMLVEVVGEKFTEFLEQAEDLDLLETEELSGVWIEELEEIRLFANKCYRDTARIYNASPPSVSDGWGSLLRF